MDCATCDNFYFSFIGLCTRVEELIPFLQAHQVLPRPFDCPKCKKPCALNQDGTRFRFRCRRMYKVPKKKARKSCNFSLTVKKGTFFEGSRLGMTTICQFICHWLYAPYPRQQFLIQELQISSRSVVYLSSLCREVCLDHLIRNTDILGGEGVTVEIDEAKIGNQEFSQGQRIDGQWIFGGFERGTNKVFVVPVPYRSSAALLAVIHKYIRPGTTIISDCWRTYNCLNDEEFRQIAVDHRLTLVDPVRGENTQNIERLWRQVRGGLPRHGQKEGHMVGYLAEFMFKRSVGHTHLIHEFMRAVAILYPPFSLTVKEEPPEESQPGPSSAQ